MPFRIKYYVYPQYQLSCKNKIYTVKNLIIFLSDKKWIYALSRHSEHFSEMTCKASLNYYFNIMIIILCTALLCLFHCLRIMVHIVTCTVFFRRIAHHKNVHVALSSYIYSQFSLAHSCCVAAQLNHARLIGLLSLLTFAKGYKW